MRWLTRATPGVTLGVTLGVPAALVVAMTGFDTPAWAQAPQLVPQPVIVREAVQDRFVDRLEALGTLLANETVSLTATVTETVTALHFDDGETIEADQVLVEMTSAEEQALLEEARSQVDEAERQLARFEALAVNGTAPRTVLDERRRDYQTAAARLQAVESRLRDRLIVAPFAGSVGLRNISVGALVEPGDVVTTLRDTSVMKLDFPVPATFLTALTPGMPIEAQATAFGARVFEGAVSGIDAAVDPTTRSIMVRAIIPNEDGLLRPGLLMTVELLNNPRDAVVIAEEALIPIGREAFVLVVDQSTEPPMAERRRIEIGARRPGEVEVVAGLAPGELVVTHGAIRVRPGQPVTITAVERGGEPLQALLGGDD